MSKLYNTVPYLSCLDAYDSSVEYKYSTLLHSTIVFDMRVKRIRGERAQTELNTCIYILQEWQVSKQTTHDGVDFTLVVAPPAVVISCPHSFSVLTSPKTSSSESTFA